jgi:aspartate aminotransferase-like enzyme
VRCAPDGRVLSIVNGAFSARFAAIAKACGRETDVLEVPYGEIATLDMVQDALAKQRYAAVTVAHSETSTGALHDVRGIAALAHDAGAWRWSIR